MTANDILQEALTVKRTMDMLITFIPDSEGDSMADGSDDQGYDERD